MAENENVENVENFDELFDGGLDEKMDFLEDKSNKKNDGIYRVDMKKVKNSEKKWRSVIRFLPNLTKDGKVAESAMEKISHYVDIKNADELRGWYDSPKNFNEPCQLSKLYYNLKDSKNAILQDKAKALKFSRKYYSYVLVIEDEQQPELVGKIMIFQYGKIIRDKINSEKKGEISGKPCNIFSLEQGKDFVLSAKEIETDDGSVFPDYKMSAFVPEKSSIPIYSEDKQTFKRVPLNEDGKIEPKYKKTIKDFLYSRDHDIEEFAPKPLTEEQQAKITEITNVLTGKASSNFNKKESGEPTSSDFDFENNLTEDKSDGIEDEDDFFS